MVYNYLLDLYKILEKRKQEINNEQLPLEATDEKHRYLQGRVDSIDEFKEFLYSRYNQKLPRRLQK